MTESTTTPAEPAGTQNPEHVHDDENAVRRAVAAVLRTASRSTGVLVGLIVLCVYMSVTEPAFLTWDNITNIIATNTVILVLAIGATFVIISGGIDLSTASAAVLAGMSYGVLLSNGHGFFVSVLGALVVGLLLGIVNGVLIAYVKVSFLVVTLGTLSIFESIALILNQGATINTFSYEGFQPLYKFALGDVAGIPYLLIFDIALVLAAAFVLRFTTFGRGVYAIGSNPEAARLNAIDVARTTLGVYALGGLLAGVATLIQIGRLTSAGPTADSTLLLTVIAAVLIGGTAYTGGDGGVGGTVLGVLFLGVIQNGLTLSDVSTFWRGTVNGVVLIVAVTLGVAQARGWLRVQRPGRRATSAGRPADHDDVG